VGQQESAHRENPDGDYVQAELGEDEHQDLGAVMESARLERAADQAQSLVVQQHDGHHGDDGGDNGCQLGPARFQVMLLTPRGVHTPPSSYSIFLQCFEGRVRDPVVGAGHGLRDMRQCGVGVHMAGAGCNRGARWPCRSRRR